MKKRILALFLLATLLLTATASATGGSISHFVRSKVYEGQFSDLRTDSTFYANVSALYEYGLSVGKPDGTFGAGESVTVSQAVIFAGRIRSLYATGSTEQGPDAHQMAGQAVYEPYLLYLQAEGVVGAELDGLYLTAATRAIVAHLLAGVLPTDAMPAINGDLVTQAYASRKFITDVTEYTPYYQEILLLYRCGISQGSSATGSFLPETPITRGALAAMLTRLVDPSLRIILPWNLAEVYSAEGTTWGDLIFDAPAYTAAPSTPAEMTGNAAYMLSREESQLTLDYGREISAVFVSDLMRQTLQEVKNNCEQMYNAVGAYYDPVTGKVTFSFSTAGSTAAQTADYRNFTLAAAIAIHDQLWESGKLNDRMSQLEKARVYYEWVCQNCTYDYNADDRSLSHIAYSLFKNGTAVCDGYTGAYNLLLKLEGIRCTALSNEEHIWTVATLDGTEYHIDTTWGDNNDRMVDYTYFAMTAEQSRTQHSW